MTIIVNNQEATELPVFTHEVSLAIDHPGKEQLLKIGPRKLKKIFLQACPNPETTVLFSKNRSEQGYIEIYAFARPHDPNVLKRDLPLMVSTSLFNDDHATELAQHWGDILSKHVPQSDFQIILSKWETHLLTKKTLATNGWGRDKRVKNYLKDAKGIAVEDCSAWLEHTNQFRLMIRGKGPNADKMCKKFSNWWTKTQRGEIENQYIRGTQSKEIYNPELNRIRQMHHLAADLNTLAGDATPLPKIKKRI